MALSAYKRGDKIRGGIVKAFLIDKDDRISNSVTLSVASGALTIAGTGGTAYEIVPAQNNWKYSEPVSDDNDANSTMVTQTLEGYMHGLLAGLTDMSKTIRQKRTEWLLQTQSGKYIYIGIDDQGMQSNGGTYSDTGQAANDPQGYQFTLTCESQDSAPIAVYSEFEAAFTIDTTYAT